MQLLILELVNVSIGICLSIAHVIRIILERNRAVVPRVRVPRWYKAVLLLALVMRGGALVVRMFSGQALAADLPQGTVILVVVGELFIAVKAVGEWCGGLGTLTILGRKGTDMVV